MYLTKLVFPVTRESLMLLGDMQAMHALVMRAFTPDTNRSLAGILIRRENVARNAKDVTVIMQSIAQPDWDKCPLPAGTSHSTVEQNFSSFKTGDAYRFRLKANPTRRDSATHALNGIGGEEQQQQWLDRKSEMHGFAVVDCMVVDQGMEYGAGRGDRKLAFRSVIYEGLLHVTDAEKFRKAVAGGIGRGKAFGFGLLSLART